ncbi:hypothetical protein DBR32_10235 [Taibaiella sp. KBW10]|uniref:TPM domain-containing protein n=1 Tax=Taibaiella sp. KBW10 TaxID=2153357 RepID=UPI000F5949DB|nr:TPM domain-containing protein [Taibaiella sp. KBW10]RQO31074.1 hypothetical protein DBR32_10235 [Taibaiella sp. KBW10]
MAIFSTSKKPLLSADEAQEVVGAIQYAEGITSGELRVYIESHCTYVNAADRAWEVFEQLKMHLTQQRNAVLIYMALKDRQIAIVGDEGIHHKVGKEQYWKKELRILQDFCKEDKIVEGLVTVIKDIGTDLGTHFPHSEKEDKNEIPDDIVFGH